MHDSEMPAKCRHGAWLGRWEPSCQQCRREEQEAARDALREQADATLRSDLAAALARAEAAERERDDKRAENAGLIRTLMLRLFSNKTGGLTTRLEPQ